MNVILIGNGGRENALARAIAQSTMLHTLYILPGNPGTAAYGVNVPIPAKNTDDIEKFALDHEVSLIVVGPEAPLVDGFADHFKKHPHILVVGPSAYGAQLEGSKAFAKKFMQRHHIPTARYFECDATNLNQGIDFLRLLNSPYVLKADGLAAGKGVLIINDISEAEHELTAMLNGKFGDASATVVIEEFLSGIEFSVFALTDGKDYVLLPEAKDYKRIGEGDAGLNTGGMGAVSPVPFCNEALMQKVIDRIVVPTINGLHAEEIDYKGFVFFGLINVNGDPFVIEYNCRMGDPETEVVFPRIDADVLSMFEAIRHQQLGAFEMKFIPETAVAVMMVSGGYPGDYDIGKEITMGSMNEDSIVFHAGTSLHDGKLVTSGGRVLAVTSFGKDIAEAAARSYQVVENIYFDGAYYRKDIGKDLM